MNTDKKNKYDLLVICQVFYPELVSTGQTLTELVEELNSSGLKIKVIASQPTILDNSKKVSDEIDYNGIKILRTWSTRFTKTSFLGKFFNLYTFFVTALFRVLFKHRKEHLVLLTNPPYLPLLGWLRYMLFRSSYGVVLFDIMPEQAELLGIIRPKGILSWIWKFSNSLWYKKASYIVVLSKDMLEGAISNANLSGKKKETACRAKTNIIHMWSDDRIIKPIHKAESTEAIRLRVLDKLVIQYSGNMGRFHDIETLLKIIKQIDKNEEIMFQFIGEGQKKRMILEFQNRLHLSNLYVSTYVEKIILPHSLAMADLGVVAQLPGQERVCYPSKLLGVMAAGKAVLAICPKSSEMAKMISENNIGFVIENGDFQSGVDFINKAKNDREMISSMGKSAFEYLQNNFTLKSAANKYYELIYRTIAKENENK